MPYGVARRAMIARSILVVGGARSGKSAYAEGLARASGLARVYLATGSAGDGEMAERIALHRAQRGPDWACVEEPLALVAALTREARAERVALVDCATFWLANLMFADRDVAAETAALVAALPQIAGPVLIVANEVGQGIVPDNALARRFRDAHGRLNQALAAACDAVIEVRLGIPLQLKPAPAPDVRFFGRPR